MADKAAGKTVRDESVEALSAWHEWKEVCAVNGCSDESQRILAKEIENGFRRKLNHFAGAFGNDGTHDFGEIDFSTEFDSALCEYEHSDKEGYEIYHKGHYGDKKHVRKAKCWKDFTWAAVAESPDPELKVIRGKLTGGVSVMNQIVEDFISRNCPGRFVNGCYIIDSSLDVKDEKGTKEEREFKKFNPDADMSLSSDDLDIQEDQTFGCSDDFDKFLEKEELPADVRKLWAEFLDKNLNVTECAILLAQSYGIALYKEKTALSELNMGKSTAYEALSEVQYKMLSLLRSPLYEQLLISFSYEESRKMIVEWMKSRLKAEKFAPSLLSMIDAIKKERES